jgi:NAD(P)-dependent dehydrogenase (short-subunit alcohol dehydrogenase family)
VSDRAEVERTVRGMNAELGPVTIVVNAAQGFGAPGTSPASPPSIGVEDMLDDVWDNTFNTGVKGTLNVCRAAFPAMKGAGHGKVVNFGSAWGQIGMEGGAAYNANKEAIRALSRTMAREWGPWGINVNVINPFVETAAMQDQRAQNPERVEAWLATIPMRRFGTPEDAGHLAVFLASSDADYITGRTFMLDGGRFTFA